MRGWLVYHPYDSRRSQAGYPDLTLVRGKRVIFAELKRSADERLRPAQQVWFDRLSYANQAVFLWIPELWDDIVNILR